MVKKIMVGNDPDVENNNDDITITMNDLDIKDITLDGEASETTDSVALGLSYVDKYKHMALKYKASGVMRGKPVARREDKDIHAVECIEIFYDTGEIYDKGSGSYSGSIAKTQATISAAVGQGAFAILTDSGDNHYVFSLDIDLDSRDVLESGKKVGMTDIETVPNIAGGKYQMDRIVTSDKSQIVPAGQHFAPLPQDANWIASLPSRTPVILVPGVMGSELVRGGQTVWPSTKENVVKSLELDADGNDIHGAVTASRVMRHFPILGGLVPIKVYDGFFTFFANYGYFEGVDLFGFAYDWRKDLQAAAKELGTLVNEVSANSIPKKVVLVAHSLGGLVARAFMLKAENRKLVDKFFIIGTPHHGAPKYMSTLIFGKEWPLPWIAVKLSEPDAKVLVRNFASIYMGTLDHTAPYDLLYVDGAAVNVADLDKVMPGQLNTSFISKSLAFHDTLNDSWSKYPFYSTYLMVSSKVPTITQVYAKSGGISDGYGIKGAGDETIPAFSSKRLAPDKEHNRVHEFGKVKHQDLAVDMSVLQRILGIMYPVTTFPSLHPGPLPVWELGNINQGGQDPLVQGDSRNELVSHLQLLLVNAGHDLSYPGSVDGIDGSFGAITDREVKKFQQSHSDLKGNPLTADGIVGPLTADALNRVVQEKGFIMREDYFTPDALGKYYDKLKGGEPVP